MKVKIIVGIIVVALAVLSIFYFTRGETEQPRPAKELRTVETTQPSPSSKPAEATERAANTEGTSGHHTPGQSEPVQQGDSTGSSGQTTGGTTREPAGETTESNEEDSNLYGTWLYTCKEYSEYVSFSSIGEYGYYVTMRNGTEQSFGGTYKLSNDGKTIQLNANGKKEKKAIEIKGKTMKLGERLYKKQFNEGEGEEA